MKHEIIERKCDVCGRTERQIKGSIGGYAFCGWYAIQKIKAGGREGMDVCCDKCLLDFAQRLMSHPVKIDDLPDIRVICKGPAE